MLGIAPVNAGEWKVNSGALQTYRPGNGVIPYAFWQNVSVVNLWCPPPPPPTPPPPPPLPPVVNPLKSPPPWKILCDSIPMYTPTVTATGSTSNAPLSSERSHIVGQCWASSMLVSSSPNEKDRGCAAGRYRPPYARCRIQGEPVGSKTFYNTVPQRNGAVLLLCPVMSLNFLAPFLSPWLAIWQEASCRRQS